MRTAVAASLVTLAALAAGQHLSLGAQAEGHGAGRLAAFTLYQSQSRTSPLESLKWFFLGPSNLSGRVNDVAVANLGGHRRLYVGFSGSGLWSTDDEGNTWNPLFTNAAVTAINAVAVAATDPSIVWILTGTTRSHIPLASAGVFKSEDAGRTWRNMGLTEIGEGGFGQIVIHPYKPNTVYVAAAGGPAAANTRGLFKTTNGGRTWSNILDLGSNSGVASLAMDPEDPDILYAVTQPRIRGNEAPWWESSTWNSMKSADYPTIYRTRDGGKRWTETVDGLPQAKFRGSIALGISPSNPNTLYATVSNRELDAAPGSATRDRFGFTLDKEKGTQVYGSPDRGTTWHLLSTESDDTFSGWVKGIRVDPSNDRTVLLFGLQLSWSTDGGHTFEALASPHADHNSIWLDPGRPTRAYDATDAGLFVLDTDHRTWSLMAAAPTAQMYDVALDSATPFHVYTSMQDQFSFRGVVDLAPGRDRISPIPFERAPGGEVTNHAIDATGRYVYATNYDGVPVTKTDLAPGRVARRMVSTIIGPRSTPSEFLYGAWFMPVLISPSDANTVYLGYQYLYRSRDSGATWERISSDLTGGDAQNRRSLDFGNLAVQTLSESPRQPGTVYAGTDNGHLYLTRDDSKSWRELTGHLPHHPWVWQALASAHEDATVFVLVRGRDDDDFSPYLYKSVDYGETFTSLVGDLPHVPINVIREDRARPRTLYIGTDFGVYVSTDGGTHWDMLGQGLPPVPVMDLQIHPRDQMMVVATFGRGIWVLDARQIPVSAR